MFQSTRPHGARPEGLDDLGLSFPVSIHAPARGATTVAVLVMVYDRFNPRARTGRDAQARTP